MSKKRGGCLCPCKGVGIIIAVVVGTAILAGVYALFKTTIIPNMTTKVGNLWNYAG